MLQGCADQGLPTRRQPWYARESSSENIDKLGVFTMQERVNAGNVAEAVMAPYRELTPAAMILGIFQGIILNLAFVYAALKLGFSIGALP